MTDWTSGAKPRLVLRRITFRAAWRAAVLVDNPFGCGSFFQGDGYTTQGYFWVLPHGEHFIITKCDFYFLKDTKLTMPNDSLYISLRLEYAKNKIAIFHLQRVIFYAKSPFHACKSVSWR